MSSFSFTCERCPNKVVLSSGEYDKRKGRVLCAHCLETAARTTTPRALRSIARNPITAHHKPSCDECGTTSNPRKAYRLDPRNWHQRYRILCGTCRSQLGYKEVDYARVERMGAYIEPPKRAA